MSVIIVLLSGISWGENTFCKEREDGIYADPVDCSKYYLCTLGIARHFSCPSGLYFNEKCMCCDYPANFYCIQSKAHALIDPCICGNPSKGRGEYYFCSILITSSIACVVDSPCYTDRKNPSSVCDF